MEENAVDIQVDKEAKTMEKTYAISLGLHQEKPIWTEEEGFVLTGYRVDHMKDELVEVWTPKRLVEEKVFKHTQDLNKMKFLRSRVLEV